MKKRYLCLGMAIIIALSLVLAGCSRSSSSSENASAQSEGLTIRWLSQGTGPSGWEGITRPILEKYEADTGVHVAGEFYSFNDLFEVIEVRAASGSSDFDVMSVDVTYVAKYGESGYLEPLDQYFSNEEKAMWDEASYVAGVWKGTMYAAPENTSTQELYYNKTLLDEAGIVLPENDAENRLTYEQVAEIARQALDILDPTGSRGLIGFDFQQISRVYQMNMLANARGGANIGADGMTLDGVINTRPWIEAMTWYQNLVKDGIASRGYTADQLPEQFYTGNMIFMIGGTWTRTNIQCDDEIGVTYAPCFEGYEDQVATSTGSWYFGINSKSRNKDAAAEFIRWFTLGEGSDMWLAINGDVPSRIDKQQEIENDINASLDMKIAAYEAANTAYPRAVTPVFGEYSTVLNQAWEDVRNGANVEEALDAAIEQFNAAIASRR